MILKQMLGVPRFAILVLSSIGLFAAVARTQEQTARHPLEPSDTSSPAATLTSLIDSCSELHDLIGDETFSVERADELLSTTQRILDCLDLSELPKELRTTAGMESALFLKEVLDRIELPMDEDIPGAADSKSNEGEPLLRWQVPHTRIAIARMELGPYRNAYLFTPGTLRRAAEDYRMVKRLPYRADGRTVSPGIYDAYIAITKQRPTQSADTSSPRGTLTLFLDSCNELHQLILQHRHLDQSDPAFDQLGQRIVSCLDTSQLPEYSREYFDAEAAVCLKEVLDRTVLPPAEEIPGIESVETMDGAETLARWQVPRTQIVISKMQEGPRRGEFLFSAETVSSAPEFYQKAISLPYRQDERGVSEGFYLWWLSSPGNPTMAALVDRLPNWFQRRSFSMALWQWIGLLPAIPLSLALMFFAFRLGTTRGERVREHNLLGYWLSLGFPLVAILIPIGFKHYAWEYLTLRGTAIYVVNFCADMVFLLAVLALIVRASSRVAESIIALPHISPTGLDANLIRIIGRVLGIVAAVIVFLEGGRHLGFPVTTLIASAGIGGLAIALSAQGLIKGLFGTVTILLDKPYRVGERIQVNGHDGYVEEIGLRSTKIRALTNHIISIPNDQMADAEIENIGKRQNIRRRSELFIPIDTPRKQVEAAIECIRRILDNHEGMDPDFPPRVFFADFTPNAFRIEIVYWYTPPDFWKYMAFSERVNLEIFTAFEQRDIQFSLPFRHSYWKHDDQQGPLEIKLKKTSESDPTST
ncbi:membrane protein containing Mechanosensitive ion channel MscS domain protein [Rhodopirellula maiorica SM1]|uniref:Membrane protein containing Mechanosensitive ion channel MscS domain protein n=1 Tax=Rhodopirellula maiorica SM1 TaxID=1265738 RepID=M5RTC0_9BACT|nr:mechanosensitive ion channel family protein [Rhodopirellula maiorica]EMI22540.1 membrane protein containing Mechanosensitive ion channel MscS domain protein [Rhodopirellula maiorica SM1]